MTSPIPPGIDQQKRWATSKSFETRNAYLDHLTSRYSQGDPAAAKRAAS
jgi:hypothetical protein